jgi:uncharacterized surface protein with fasciclin (FAS1) repeats
LIFYLNLIDNLLLANSFCLQWVPEYLLLQWGFLLFAQMPSVIYTSNKEFLKTNFIVQQLIPHLSPLCNFLKIFLSLPKFHFIMFSSKITGMPIALALAILTTFSFIACKKDTVVTPTIADTVIAGANFTLLKAALTKAELVTTFQGTGTFTVFAPTDDAFKAVGIDQAFITANTKEALAAVLKFHVLGTKVSAADIATADNTEVTTLNGKAYITKNASGVSINGAKVTTADVAASNGVIHVIDRLILPPSTDIVAFLQANANYSLLVEAVVKAGLVSTLQGVGPFTVFAPNNAAFIALGAPYATAAGIKGLDATQTAALKNILLYHVIGARVFSQNLKAGSVGTALATKSVTIDLTSGVKVIGIAAGNSAGVVTSPVGNFNAVATNGVIHTIDKVLLPQ